MNFAATPPFDGTLAKFYNNDANFCYKIAHNMNLEEGAMVEPVAVAVAICKQADLRAHQTFLVLGCGPIGVLCQAVAKTWDASRVVGIDVIQSRLNVAKYYGVSDIFSPSRPEVGTDPILHAEKVAAQLNKECGLGDGPDVVLECSGAEPCIQLGIFRSKERCYLCSSWHGKRKRHLSCQGCLYQRFENTRIHQVHGWKLSCSD
jgi:D-xylulose reductase